MSAFICPQHGRHSQPHNTSYGILHRCPVMTCDWRCWDGPTSTPANDALCELRNRCHAAFDPIWKKPMRLVNRNDAYRWMQRRMGLSAEACHIGMFDEGQCRKLLRLLEGLPDDPTRARETIRRAIRRRVSA